MATVTGACPYYWDVDKFIAKAQEVHGDRWNYDYLKGMRMKGSITRIDVICTACQRVSTMTAADHIICRGTCKWCKRGYKEREKWSLDRLHRCLAEDKYANFEVVSVEEPVEIKSKIIVKCRVCNTETVRSIYYFLQHPACKHCNRLEAWTMQRFLDAAYDIHGDKYDYTAVRTIAHWSIRTSVPITCRTCHHSWQQRLDSHINKHCGCPKWKSHPV